MNFFFLILCFYCVLQSISGNWRFTLSSGVSSLHFPTQSRIERYYISGREVIVLQTLNNSNINFLSLNMDPARLCIIKDANILICPGSGKYEIAFITGSCVNCDDNEMTIRISETSYCYYWSVTTSVVNSSQVDVFAHYVIFQISVSSLSNSSSEMNEMSLEIVNRMLHSRGENPVLIDVFGRKLENISSLYNPVSSTWNITIPHVHPTNSSYLLVTAERGLPIFGCGIAPTEVLLSHPIQSKLGQNFGFVKLTSSRKLIGQPRYHPCAYERVVLPTADGIFYTSDHFVTTSLLVISTSLANIYGVEVTHIEMINTLLLLILQGELFAAEIGDRNLLLKHLALLENLGGSLSGISSYPLCLINPSMTNIFAWESRSVLAWSASFLFIHYEIYGDILERNTWISMKLPQEYSESIIVKAKLETSLNKLWILARDRNLVRILECEFRQLEEQLTCSVLDLSNRLPQGVYEWEFLNSAHLSVFLWTSTSIYYYFNDGFLEGTFQEITSVHSVAFNRDKTKYLIEANDHALLYGSGKSTSLVNLTKVEFNTSDYVYKFRHADDEVIRISWSNGSFKQEMYPLYKEVYSALHRSGDNNTFCDYSNYHSTIFNQDGNVVNLEYVGQEILINVSFTHPASTVVGLSIFTFFHDLVLMRNMTVFVSTYVIPGRPLLRTQNFRGFLQGACTDSGLTCDNGIAVFEVDMSLAQDSTRPTCLLPANEVLYINITCPDGMHVRIRQGFTDAPEQCNLPQNDPLLGFYLGDYDKIACHYRIPHPYTFYPLVEIHTADGNSRAATDDVRLTEVNSATGFELINRNLMLKDCFLCEHFHPLNASSIILQTPLSACPCRIDRYDPNMWIGNLSFTYTDSPYVTEPKLPWKDVLIFDVELLSKSHCNLSTKLILYLLKTPTISQHPLEMIVLAGFAFITVMILMFSYLVYTSIHEHRQLAT